VVILARGRVIAEDTPASLVARLRGARALRFRVRGAERADLDALRQVPGVGALRVASEADGLLTLEVEGDDAAALAEPLARAAVERGLGIRELTPVGMSLEAIFLELTMREDAGVSPAAQAPAPETAAGTGAARAAG